MKKSYLLLTIVLVLTGSTAFSQTLVHYWNFNTLPTGTLTTVSPDFTLLSGAAITYPGTGAGYMDRVDPGTGLNSQNSDPAGYGLRPRNPSDTRELLIAFPTTGYDDILVSFATAKTSNGATEQYYDYSLDGGANFITTDLSLTTFLPNTEPTYDIVNLNFSNITGADNNANFVVRIRFGGATSIGSSGNNRFDNITVTSGVVVSTPTSVEFADNFIVVNEDAGTLNFDLTLSNPSTSSIDLVVKTAPFSTADASDFTLTTQTLNFTGSSNTTQTITIPIVDDNLDEQVAEYFVLYLENPVNATITGDAFATIYIKDNDRLAPVPTQDIELQYVGSFDPSGSNSSTCEIVVYDAATERLFTTSAIAGFLDIIDFSNPAAPSVVNSVDMSSYGGITSVAVKNGVVAVAAPNANEQSDGSVVFFDTDGVYITDVTVGALPDMVTFTPDGSKVLTANEGQPNSDYSVDPEGSVSIIDISGGVANLQQSDVNTLVFTQFNALENALIGAGVRKLKASSTLSQDFEPEYISISPNSQKAWVTLQENNAVAEINLVTEAFTGIVPLGTKDMSLPGNGFDASDNNGEVLIANWPVKSFYIPDAIANYNIGGTTYLVTANEGDEKEYTNLNERTTVGAGSYLLDATIFPNAEVLKKSSNAGRFRVTNLYGDNGTDGDFEEIYSVGTRSFSIWNADNQTLVYDSGDDFEYYTSTEPTISAIFNCDNENNTFKSRSRAKGPEPEGLTLAELSGKTYAFVGLERVGGVMVYDVTDPANAFLVDYKNSRSTSSYTGDHGPEGITFISAQDSPDGNAYIVVANEISGTIAVYEVVDNNNTVGLENTAAVAAFNLFPNPSSGATVYFNRAADIEVTDVAGKLTYTASNAQSIDVSNYSKGVYFVRTSEGLVKQLVVK
jgi:hypothetical protein